MDVMLPVLIYYFFFYIHWFNSRKNCWHSDIPFWPRHLTTRHPKGLQRLRACSSILSSSLNLSIKMQIDMKLLNWRYFCYVQKKYQNDRKVKIKWKINNTIFKNSPKKQSMLTKIQELTQQNNVKIY